MNNLLILKLSNLLSLLLIYSFATSIIAQRVEEEVEFSYNEGSENGPSNWGNIKEEWESCKTGITQSPIILFPRLPQRIPKSKKITKFYKPGETIINIDHSIELEWNEKNNSKIQINNTHYFLLNVHWHSPSEHALNGIRYALEAHFVHQSVDNKTAVIAFLYKFGLPDPFLSSIEDKIRQKISNETAEVKGGTIDPSTVRMGCLQYYKYIGSLTTPPCSEPVLWTVETTLGTVSLQQVNLLRGALGDGTSGNARPLQPINGRILNLYDTRFP
ncbi:unnamed protein product [Amaranthus hypochondriacus]